MIIKCPVCFFESVSIAHSAWYLWSLCSTISLFGSLICCFNCNSLQTRNEFSAQARSAPKVDKILPSSGSQAACRASAMYPSQTKPGVSVSRTHLLYRRIGQQGIQPRSPKQKALFSLPTHHQVVVRSGRGIISCSCARAWQIAWSAVYRNFSTADSRNPARLWSRTVISLSFDVRLI